MNVEQRTVRSNHFDALGLGLDDGAQVRIVATLNLDGLQMQARIAHQAAGALGDHLEGIERSAIVQALEKTRYNSTAAAKRLGMSFRALRSRIEKLVIE